MKNAIPIVLLSIVIFCGCAKTHNVTPMVYPSVFSADLSYNGGKYKADIALNKNGNIKAVITSPNSLKGMQIDINDASCSVTYKSVTYNSDDENLPILGAVSSVYKVLNSAELKKPLKCRQGKNCIVKAKTGDSEFSLTMSPAGIPLSISSLDNELEIIISNFKY